MYILYIIVLDFKLLSLDYIPPTLLFLLKLFTSSLLTVTISSTSVIIPHNFNIHTDLSKPGLAMFDLLSFSDFILQPLVIPLTLSLQTNKQTNKPLHTFHNLNFTHFILQTLPLQSSLPLVPQFQQSFDLHSTLYFIGSTTFLLPPTSSCP